MHPIRVYYAYMNMNKKTFRQRDIATTIELLCEAYGEPLFKNRKVAQTVLGKKCGVDPSVISRVLSGATKKLEPENVLKLAKYFKITSAQMRGEMPIDRLDGVTDEDDLAFIERFKSHPDELREALKAYEEAWINRR